MQTLISGRGLSCDLPRGSSFPPLIPVRREFESRAVADVAEETRKAMLELNLEDRLRSGDRVLVAAGSRGIKDKAEILSGVCAYLRELDVTPTILGAMGSHGGGTAAGQRDVLESLGITEERVGARIITSDEAVAIGEAEDGQTVYCDPLVFEYDGFLAVNRIKPHTTARGAIQSGIIKMLVVGMGSAWAFTKWGISASNSSPVGLVKYMFFNNGLYSSINADSSPLIPLPYTAENVWISGFLPLSKMVDTMAEESSPPLRQTPTGTSLRKRNSTADWSM